MNSFDYDTLSQAINDLTQNGYPESFKAEENTIKAIISRQKYQPENLKILETFRFDGMTNPQDDTVLFALKADDGTKGTMVMSYGAEQGQNVELIKKIPKQSE